MLSQIKVFKLRIIICGNSLMVKPRIVIPIIWVQFPVVTPNILACSSAAEQTAVNRPVVGSIPTVPAILKCFLMLLVPSLVS